MIIIKNSKELKKLVNKDKDLIYPNEDLRIEFEPFDKIRDVRCRDLFMMNGAQKFDFNSRDFNGNNFNGGKVSYWAFFNCYGSIKCKSIDGKRDPHAKPVALDDEIEITGEEDLED